MWQTIYRIPHELGGVPVFGWGWAVLVWCLVAALIVGGSYRRRGFDRETQGLLPVLILVAAALVFLLPLLEEPYVASDGTPSRGLPIRGYGTLMFCGVAAAVALALYRGRQRGLHADLVYSLAMWICIGGIVGGRLFYVIQYRDQYRTDSLWQLLNIAQGGLVVYGALCGALVAFAVFVMRTGAPLLVLADLIAPSMLLGLAFGRLGCLLNGCCYGGTCELSWKVTFPEQTPAYLDHFSRGWEYGMLVRTDDQQRVVVDYVQPSGAAEQAGLRAGNIITALDGVRLDAASSDGGHRASPAADAPAVTAMTVFNRGRDPLHVTTASGQVYTLPAAAQHRSAPIHPTQIYSAINAALLCLLLLAYAPFQRRDGELFALLLTVYPITRFLLELIRRDELAIGQTGLTIAQLISMGLLLLAGGCWWYVLQQPRRSPAPSPSGS